MTLSTPQVIKQGNSYHVQHGTDAGLFVQFYMESVKDEEKSAEAGRPIFVDREYIKIIPAGDKNTVICRPVRLHEDAGSPPDDVRWPNHYAAFKRQQEQVQEGTPLEVWPLMTKSQVLMYKALNVHTVEQLVAVSDANLQNLGMGARELQQKAKAYLDNATDGALVMKLKGEVEALKNEIEALRNQNNGVEQENKRRGRPPKTVEGE